jgi:Janus/Ocnus family (Ocnus)
MAMEIVDYTQLYYTAIAKTNVPPVIIGKFVQIRNELMEYLVLSPKEFTKYHANIVERFCLDKGLEGYYDADRKRYDIYDQAWIVVGGGKFEIDATQKTIRFYNDSMVYGKFDSQGLTEKVSSFPPFSGFSIVLDN